MIIIEDFQSFFAEEYFDQDNFIDNMKTKKLDNEALSTVSISKDF